MTCTRCGKSAFPSFVLSNRTGKLVAQCSVGDCLATDETRGPSSFTTTISAESGTGPEPVLTVTPPATKPPPFEIHPFAAPQLSRPQVAAAPAVQAKPGKPMTGRQLVALARARVREIDQILRGMPSLQAERAQLSALILAAAPRPPVKAERRAPH